MILFILWERFYKRMSPKNPDPSKVAILRTQTPAIQVQTPPLEGPRILRVLCFLFFFVKIFFFLSLESW